MLFNLDFNLTQQIFGAFAICIGACYVKEFLKIIICPCD